MLGAALAVKKNPFHALDSSSFPGLGNTLCTLHSNLPKRFRYFSLQKSAGFFFTFNPLIVWLIKCHKNCENCSSQFPKTHSDVPKIQNLKTFYVGYHQMTKKNKDL